MNSNEPSLESLLASLPQPQRAGQKSPRRRLSYRRRNRMIPYVISLNLTAMIDTVFNLLFLFIIISRFGALEGMLPAKLPARASAAVASPATELPRTPLRIRMTADPADAASCLVTIDHFKESPFKLAELGPALRAISRSGAGFDRDTPVHLLARDDVAWDHVVNAYNAAMTAEFAKIYFAGTP